MGALFFASVYNGLKNNDVFYIFVNTNSRKEML